MQRDAIVVAAECLESSQKKRGEKKEEKRA